jgi:trehalose 6-phosphate synthase/phosphatase
MQPGVVIVSNRLPVSVKRVDGRLEFYPSIGGLATGLSSYAGNKRNKWIGWPGLPNEDLSEADRQQITHELKKHNCYPVFLSKKQLDRFYSGFSNSILWPAFHEMKPKKAPLEDESLWRAYRQVNEAFAEAVLARSTRGSIVWVHDYQLLLVPEMLRKLRPNDRIGFFLHIPFPARSVFEKLPHSRRLISGLIGADLIGFHTPSYVGNFLDCCQLLDIAATGDNELVLPDRVVRVTDFPMGIDYDKYTKATKQREIKRSLQRLKLKYHGKKVVLSVDRIDPTKGIVERLQAYQEFLRTNKQLHKKVVMIMIAIPSRTEIDTYKNLKKRVDKLVDDINAEFGTARWTPVEYKTTPLSFSQLSPYFQLADVALVTPIRDGMNLVAKEYIASRGNNSGVLVLSETAGAAEELKDAILVNPKQRSSLIDGMKQALTLPKRELAERTSKMNEHISQFTVQRWAGSFMRNLQQTKPTQRNAPFAWQLTHDRQREIASAYRAGNHRLLLFDYDGVLVPFHGNPKHAKPGKPLLTRLGKLSRQPHTHLVIISGRPQSDLAEWFGDLPNLTLVAEHGAFVRRRKTKRWQTAEGLAKSWKSEVLDLLEYYNAKTPGATIEEKAASLVWHYRRANPYYSHKHLVILKRALGKLAKDQAIQVEQGNMILEIRPSEVHKGTASIEHLAEHTDFVLAIGDDSTDEDMFRHLPIWAHTVKVGRGRTAARYRAKNVDTIHELIKRLSR